MKGLKDFLRSSESTEYLGVSPNTLRIIHLVPPNAGSDFQASLGSRSVLNPASGTGVAEMKVV